MVVSAVSSEPAINDASIFDYDAFDAAPLQSDPFDFLVVPDFIPSAALSELNRDYPEIDRPANIKLSDLTYGPAFAAFLEELQGPRLARHFERKFDVDLEGCETVISVRKFCEVTDGNIHTDHRAKIITVLVYFNEDWENMGGQLRMLRSPTDIEDYAAEVPPAGGTLLAFRRTDTSWHGHKQYVGERRVLQMSWSRPSSVVNLQRRVNRATKPIRRLLNMS